MPGGHRRFIERIESIANIRDYTKRFRAEDEVTIAYNLAVSSLTAFRDIHIRIVTRYIIGPSREPLQNLSGRNNIAFASSNNASKVGLAGTGGTELMPFLKQSRDETKETALLRGASC